MTCSPHFGRDATAATYRDIHLPRVFAPWARILVDLVPVHAGEAVLDVATGPGTVARVAAALVGPRGRVVGVDVSAAMLAIARDWPPLPNAAPIDYIESSGAAMPVDDAAFDVAYCQQGLQHMSDPMAALREMRRALRPGGRLGVAVWVSSPFGLFREVADRLDVAASGPRPSDFGRDADQLAAALRKIGFESVEVHRREWVALLEGGVPQALEMAAATSGSVAMSDVSDAQAARLRAAIAEALEPFTHADGVHLASVANIARATA